MVLPWGAAALPAQKLFYAGEWPYDAVAYLAAEQRIAFIPNSCVTVAQTRAMLADMDPNRFSEEGKALYERLAEYLDSEAALTFSNWGAAFGFDPQIEPEVFVRSNPIVPWIWNWDRRKPFAAFPLNLSYSKYAAIEWSLDLDQNFSVIDDDDNYTNFPFTDFNFNVPRHGYAALGFPVTERSGFFFRVGIGEDFYTCTHMKSVILSDSMKDVSYGRLMFYSPLVQYSANIMQLDTDKNFYYHTLGLRVMKRVTVSALEGAMVNAPLELRFLDPMIIFHSLSAYSEYAEYNKAMDESNIDNADSRVASFVGIVIDTQPFRGLRFYSIWALNELQTFKEREEDPDILRTDSFAFQAGTEYAFPVSSGRLTLGLEGVYTYPYAYVSKDKRWSFYKPETAKSGKISWWTGSPFGPDTAAASIWASYSSDGLLPADGTVPAINESTGDAVENSWSVKGDFTFAALGKRSGLNVFNGDAYHPWRTGEVYNRGDIARQELRLVSPTKTAVFMYRPQIEGSWSPRDWLTLGAMLGYTMMDHYAHVASRWEHGVEFAFRVRVVPRFPKINEKLDALID